MTTNPDDASLDALEAAQQDRRKALIERLGTVADLACATPFPGDLGDVAYDLLRQAAAQISSDRLRFARAKAATIRDLRKRDGDGVAGEGGLKPCPNPWCCSHDRSDPELFAAHRPIAMPLPGEAFAICCPVCPISGAWKDTEAEAVAAWNARTPEPREVRVEVLEAALRASLAKRSIPTMDQNYSAAFNAALDMVARDTAAALNPEPEA